MDGFTGKPSVAKPVLSKPNRHPPVGLRLQAPHQRKHPAARNAQDCSFAVSARSEARPLDPVPAVSRSMRPAPSATGSLTRGRIHKLPQSEKLCPLRAPFLVGATVAMGEALYRSLRALVLPPNLEFRPHGVQVRGGARGRGVEHPDFTEPFARLPLGRPVVAAMEVHGVDPWATPASPSQRRSASYPAGPCTSRREGPDGNGPPRRERGSKVP